MGKQKTCSDYPWPATRGLMNRGRMKSRTHLMISTGRAGLPPHQLQQDKKAPGKQLLRGSLLSLKPAQQLCTGSRAVGFNPANPALSTEILQLYNYQAAPLGLSGLTELWQLCTEAGLAGLKLGGPALSVEMLESQWLLGTPGLWCSRCLMSLEDEPGLTVLHCPLSPWVRRSYCILGYWETSTWMELLWEVATW